MSILNKFKKSKKPDKEIKDKEAEKETKKTTEKKTEKKEKPEKKKEQEEKKKTEPKKEERLRPVHGSAFLMKQAWITEKATDLSALGKYIFIVDKKANKPETKKAIESIYRVKVASVNIVNVKSKEKRLGRSLGRTSAFKKAIVTLKPGEKIDITPT